MNVGQNLTLAGLAAVLIACGGEGSSPETSSDNKTTTISFLDGSSVNIANAMNKSPESLKSINYEPSLSIGSGTRVVGFTQVEDETHEFKLKYSDDFSVNEGIVLENKNGIDFRVSSSSGNNFQFLKTVKSGDLLGHTLIYSINLETNSLVKPTHSEFTIINAAEVGEYTLSLIDINRDTLELSSSQHLLKYSDNRSRSWCMPTVTFSNDASEEAIARESGIINSHNMTDTLDEFQVFDFGEMSVTPFNATTGARLAKASADGVIFTVSDQEVFLREADPSQYVAPIDYNITYDKTYTCEWDNAVIDDTPIAQALECSVEIDYVKVRKLYTSNRSGDVVEYIPAGSLTEKCTVVTEKDRKLTVLF